jgi:hypothetical protein
MSVILLEPKQEFALVTKHRELPALAFFTPVPVLQRLRSFGMVRARRGKTQATSGFGCRWW